ncbi:hypothetical protein DVDV_1671 [Desulfovibrio sp. DV]|uniref:hypothetical protein n=1 Tax=Desulfovibrio sp. DV TaxID=1844708 RepID=UPI00094BBE21|nr:hypothetical protein [Desulfovibrio sp. DV]OLN28290.1 hypothetical protein DVDV_1671 [Desulfovibrio sp. DV]
MLFLLNKSRKDCLEELRILGGDEDKAVLLVGDAVYLGLPGQAGAFENLGVDEVFADADSAAARGVALDDSVAAVGFERMARLIMDDHDQVISL